MAETAVHNDNQKVIPPSEAKPVLFLEPRIFGWLYGGTKRFNMLINESGPADGFR